MELTDYDINFLSVIKDYFSKLLKKTENVTATPLIDRLFGLVQQNARFMALIFLFHFTDMILCFTDSFFILRNDASFL